MYLRNLTYPRMMLGTPTNSTVSMIAGDQKGVTITAQEGRQDCFVQMRFNTPRDTSLVFQTDIWNVVGDQSTVQSSSSRRPETSLSGSPAPIRAAPTSCSPCS